MLVVLVPVAVAAAAMAWLAAAVRAEEAGGAVGEALVGLSTVLRV
jgi:hypothetical protein